MEQATTSSPLVSPIEMTVAHSFQGYSPPRRCQQQLSPHERQLSTQEEDTASSIHGFSSTYDERTAVAAHRMISSFISTRQNTAPLFDTSGVPSPLTMSSEPATEIRAVHLQYDDDNQNIEPTNGEIMNTIPSSITKKAEEDSSEPRPRALQEDTTGNRRGGVSRLQLELDQAVEDPFFYENGVVLLSSPATQSPGMPTASTAVFSSGELAECSPSEVARYRSLSTQLSLPSHHEEMHSTATPPSTIHLTRPPRMMSVVPMCSEEDHHDLIARVETTPVNPTTTSGHEDDADLFLMSQSGTPQRLGGGLAALRRRNSGCDSLTASMTQQQAHHVHPRQYVDPSSCGDLHEEVPGWSNPNAHSTPPYSTLLQSRLAFHSQHANNTLYRMNKMLPLQLDETQNCASRGDLNMLNISPLTPAAPPTFPPTSHTMAAGGGMPPFALSDQRTPTGNSTKGSMNTRWTGEAPLIESMHPAPFFHSLHNKGNVMTPLNHGSSPPGYAYSTAPPSPASTLLFQYHQNTSNPSLAASPTAAVPSVSTSSPNKADENAGSPLPPMLDEAPHTPVCTTAGVPQGGSANRTSSSNAIGMTTPGSSSLFLQDSPVGSFPALTSNQWTMSPQPETPVKTRRNSTSRMGTPQKSLLTPQKMVTPSKYPSSSHHPSATMTPGGGTALMVLDVNFNPFSQSRGPTGEMQAVTDFHLPTTAEALNSLSAVRHRRTVSMEVGTFNGNGSDSNNDGTPLLPASHGGFPAAVEGRSTSPQHMAGDCGLGQVVTQRPLAAHAAAVTYASSVTASLNASRTPSRCITPVHHSAANYHPFIATSASTCRTATTSPQPLGSQSSQRLLHLMQDVSVTDSSMDGQAEDGQEKSPDALAKTMDPHCRRPSRTPQTLTTPPVILPRQASMRSSPFAGMRILGGNLNAGAAVPPLAPTPTATAPTSTNLLLHSSPSALLPTIRPHSQQPPEFPRFSPQQNSLKGSPAEASVLSNRPCSHTLPALASPPSSSSDFETSVFSPQKTNPRRPSRCHGVPTIYEDSVLLQQQQQRHDFHETVSPARGLLFGEDEEDEDDFLFRTTNDMTLDNDSVGKSNPDDEHETSMEGTNWNAVLHADASSSSSPQKGVMVQPSSVHRSLFDNVPQRLVFSSAAGGMAEEEDEDMEGRSVTQAMQEEYDEDRGASCSLFSHSRGAGGGFFPPQQQHPSLSNLLGHTHSSVSGGGVSEIILEGDDDEIGDRFRRARFTFHHLNPLSHHAEFIPLHVDRNGAVWLGICRLDGQPYSIKEIPFSFLNAEAERKEKTHSRSNSGGGTGLMSMISAELKCLTLGSQLQKTTASMDAADHIVRYHNAWRDTDAKCLLLQTEYFTKGNVAEAYLCKGPSSGRHGNTISPHHPAGLFAPHQHHHMNMSSSTGSSSTVMELWEEGQILVMIGHVLKALRAIHLSLGIVHGSPLIWNVFAATNYHYKLGCFGSAHTAVQSEHMDQVPVWCPTAHYPTHIANSETENNGTQRLLHMPLVGDCRSEFSRDYFIFAHSLLSFLVVLVEQRVVSSSTSSGELSSARVARPRLSTTSPSTSQHYVPSTTPPLAPSSLPSASPSSLLSVEHRQYHDGEYIQPDTLLQFLHQHRGTTHHYSDHLFQVITQLFSIETVADVDRVLHVALHVPSTSTFHLQNCYDREIVRVLQNIANLKAKKEALLKKHKRPVSPRLTTVVSPEPQQGHNHWQQQQQQSMSSMRSLAPPPPIPRHFRTTSTDSTNNNTSHHIASAGSFRIQEDLNLPEPAAKMRKIDFGDGGHTLSPSSSSLQPSVYPPELAHAGGSLDTTPFASPQMAPNTGTGGLLGLPPLVMPVAQSQCCFGGATTMQQQQREGGLSVRSTSCYSNCSPLSSAAPRFPTAAPLLHRGPAMLLRAPASPPATPRPGSTSSLFGATSNISNPLFSNTHAQGPPPSVFHYEDGGTSPTPHHSHHHPPLPNHNSRWGGYSVPTTPRLQVLSSHDAAKHRMDRLVRSAAPGASTKTGTACAVHRLFFGAKATLTATLQSAETDEGTMEDLAGAMPWQPVPRRPFSSLEIE